jgi:MFS family permease
MCTLSFVFAAPALWAQDVGNELLLNDAEKGLFLGASAGGLCVAMLIAGPLADRFGFRMPLVGGAALQAIGLVAISQAPSATWLVAGAAVGGLGTGSSDALLTPIACALYPQHRTRVANLLHAFYPVGLVVTTLLVGLQMYMDWTWRASFLQLAALPVVYALLLVLVPLPATAHGDGERTEMWAYLRRGAYWLFILAMLLGAAAEMAASNWLPDFVKRTAEAGRLGAGLGLILFGSTMGLARLFVSALVHKLGARRLIVLCGVLSAAFLLLAAYFDDPWWVTVMWLSLLGFAVAPLWPTILACAGDRFPRAGATMYTVLGAAGAFGGLLGPVVFGVIAEASGLNIAMAVLAAAPVLLTLIMLGMLRSRSSQADTLP